MSLEERLEQAEKLVAEVKAELAAMRATKRNWPERIEEGMVFRFGPSRLCIVAKWFHVPRTLMSLEPGNRMSSQDGDAAFEETERIQGKCVYLGHARDILTIRTDAHDPTGAELVGRRVNCFDMLDQLQFEGVCDEYDPDATCPYRIGRVWYFKARLAK